MSRRSAFDARCPSSGCSQALTVLLVLTSRGTGSETLWDGGARPTRRTTPSRDSGFEDFYLKAKASTFLYVPYSLGNVPCLSCCPSTTGCAQVRQGTWDIVSGRCAAYPEGYPLARLSLRGIHHEQVRLALPLLSEYGTHKPGTHKTAKARFWPWLSSKSP